MNTKDQNNALKDLISEFARNDGWHDTAIDFLKLVRTIKPQPLQRGLMNPAFVLPAQGVKKVVLGTTEYLYDSSKYLVVSVDLPVAGGVVKASSDKPYLSIFVDLTIEEIAEIARDCKLPLDSKARQGSGLIVSPLDSRIHDVCVRLVSLLRTPEDIPVLAPLMKKELIYLLLRGNQRQLLEFIVTSKKNRQRVEDVIDWIKTNFASPLVISNLAKKFKMSPSSLHHSFKDITRMSPLQYQKTVRLMEARRLLQSGNTTASSVGYEVGYESPAQFSREYKRYFGVSPSKDLNT